jgi:hypothetical protein
MRSCEKLVRKMKPCCAYKRRYGKKPNKNKNQKMTKNQKNDTKPKKQHQNHATRYKNLDKKPDKLEFGHICRFF